MNIFKIFKKNKTEPKKTLICIQQSSLNVFLTTGVRFRFDVDKGEHDLAYYWEVFTEWYHNSDLATFSLTTAGGEVTSFRRDLVSHYTISASRRLEET